MSEAHPKPTQAETLETSGIMRAIQYYGPGDIRLCDIPEPQVKAGQVKIKVLCGSDLHAYFSILPVTPTTLEPHVVTGETLPIGMGHEFSGTITETGPGVDTSRFHVGQKVVVEPLLSCRKSTCPSCVEGSRNTCRYTTFVGLGGGGGGLSEFTCVDQDLVHPLPAGIPLDVGALMEPLAVAWHAVKRSNIKRGDHVLVLGAGPIGLLVLRVARVFGAASIAVCEPASRRRDLAETHGADIVYDPTAPNADVPAAIRKATGDRGADVVFDCAGTQRTLDTAFQTVRPRGNIVNVAVWEKRPTLDIDAVTYKEVNFTGVIAYDRDHPEMLRAVAEGKFKGLENLITRRIGLEDFVDKGIHALIHEKDQHVKILVHPSQNEPSSRAKL
ncbi:alcohol dehydrogenase GroES domain protein [Lentinus tigrinus ALCF2SS1-7]|uniref:Alcohol dehydrogenase GroES domain protein n=1 Tax=Lentinus tigrinus ALCF2SS1-6 TaxID=1328759 RepID=A0A5C2SBK1_9APHY|nr:alcohol dehydrogenase GroES domain protein [Lentinus tigrinus ALCF2SS1-6]RPD75905.1 alcohol dehydrogenase GroES domain protein [Lentinus tigrinus ALCF2SS1-7]